MKYTFKTRDEEEGVTSLWYSYKGRLHKVAIFIPEELPELDEEIEELFRNVAVVFLRGFDLGRAG